MTGLEATLPLHLDATLGMKEDKLGIFLMALTLPNIVVSSLIGYISDRYGRRRISALGFALLALSSFLIGYLPTSTTGLILTMILFGSASSIGMTPLLGELADSVGSSSGTPPSLT